MATGQTVLDLMEVLAPELQLQSAEADVVKGLIVLNRAQSAFEMLLAQYPDVKGGAIGTVTTTASTESTAFPSGVIRIDGLDYIDPATSRPAWPLVHHQRRGGHAWSQGWIGSLWSTATSGKPRAYWTNGTNIYWDPLPDATHTVRYYGFSVAAAITAAGTFAYPDFAILPLAIFAVKIVKIGIEDSVQDLTALARDVFDPTIKLLGNYQRESAPGYQYKHSHNT